MNDQKKPIAATKEQMGSARPSLPPFTRETAIQKVRLAEVARIPVIRKKCLWRTLLNPAGESVPSL